ncbi:MAG TPA: cytochrome c [Bacillales bacterium]|nr:cytochrome c [Bacillales bacterium]
MKKTNLLVAAVGLSIGLTACGSSDGGNSAGGSSEQSGARAIFEQNCASCHGENLEGGFGPSLEHIGSELSKKEILEQIKTGGGGMPEHIIKGDKAEKVAEWLASKK